jgi:uncharacterized protein YbaA (DUF1428 family)
MPMYLDGFILPIPKKRLADYKKIATAASKIWKRNGAIAYVEAAGEDMNAPGMIDYPALAKAKKDEVVIFAWAMFKSKAARNKANQALMTDPQMIKLMDKMNANPIMDCKRMAYGGFNVIVKA